MTNYVLWRRLTETDFNAIHGRASPHGHGGGARHVALGVRTDAFRIDRFLNSSGRSNVTITAAAGPGNAAVAPLSFSSNPNRRGGEWTIRDQFSHRHPAWSSGMGFPATYDPADPPYLLVFRVGTRYHARFLLESSLPKRVMPAEMRSEEKGIIPAPPRLLEALGVPGETLFETFETQEKEELLPPFDPNNIEDGRRRVFGAVIRRLGQQGFRRKLILAYATRCAVTQCTTPWVLEAAHITPYRGIKTNAISNGLLLRADIHTLFDLALISVEPDQLRVCVSSKLGGSNYERLHGRSLLLPKKSSNKPNAAALTEHHKLFYP